jgi:uncharacterized repeat protein (TIGR02543 family)
VKKTSSVLLAILLVLVVFTTQGCFLFRNVTLSIENSELSIEIGESEQIRIKVKPEDATLKFSSNKESVATVSTSGMVTGVSAGEAEITIEATKDKYKSALKTVSVQVVGEESFSVTFSVSDSSGALEGADVTFNGETKTTDVGGEAVFAGVLAGNKDYTVSKTGYNEAAGSVNVDEDETEEVTLERKTYIITATAGTGGSIDPSGEVEVDYGDSINFSVIADDGYAVEDVVSDGVSIGQVDNYTYTKVTSDHTIHATFKLKTYTLTTSVVGQGTVTKNPNKPTYDHGEEVQLTANPDEGWNFASWSGDLSGSANPANITMDSNKTVTATFTIKKYTIAASANPPAGGSVSGGGNYTHGDTVDLAATPNEGYEFINWTENGVQVSANAAYWFTATANRTLVANFRLKTYTITATAGAGGSINPAGNVNVTHGSNQSFTITPDTGYDIEDVKVDGVPVGAVSSYTFNNLTANHTIAATFKLKTYSLTTNAVGQGTVTKNPNRSTYDHGEEVQLTANPDEGWNFASWSGDLSGSANPANITMDSNKTVTATFTIKKYTIAASANPPAGGSVSGGGNYTHGDTVDLAATPNEGYEFINWTENGVQVSANAAYWFTATANRTLVANFRLKTYTITATAGSGGSIDPSGDVSVNHGDDQKFAITPDEGYNVEDVLVDGESIGPRTSYTFAGVASNHTIHASFSLLPPPTYTVTFNVSDNQGAVQGASVTFYGETKATDVQGKAVFTGVLAGNRAYTVSKTGYNNATGNVNVDGDETVGVILTKKTYTLTTNVVGQGTVTKNPNKPTYDHGEEVQLTATPDEGWNFAGWSGDLSGTVNPANITMDSNKTITATFTIKKYTIAASANPPAGGAITGAGSHTHGDTVNLVATPNEGYEFVNWTENGVQVSANAAYSFTATANRTLVANFRLKTYTITATAGAGGNINPAGNVQVEHGSNRLFNITPNTGYEIEDVKVDGVSVGAVSTYNFTNVTANHTIHATFRLKTYTIAASANPPAGGAITGAGSHTHGDTVNLVATPSEGYEFINWTENGVQVSANAAYSFTATANRTLVANFRLKTYTITATAGAGGSINPAGNVNVTHGSNQSFTITPDTGYDIEDVKVDGVSVGAVSSYTFNNMTANHTIAATFKLKTYSLTTNVVGQGTVTKNPDKATYTHGEVVQLTANPSAGWAFGTWSGDLSGSANPANLTMNGNKTVTANFVRVYTVTFNVSDNQGAVQGANVAFNGENKSTNAQGKAVFTNVKSGSRSYTISKTGYNNDTGNVNVDGDETVDVILTKKTYTINVSANPAAGGTAAGGGIYTHGDTVNLSATPKEGYRFLNWTENGAQVSTNANYSFTATKNRTLVANFTTISKGTIQINNTTMDGFKYIDIYAEGFEFGVAAIEYVLSFDPAKLNVIAISNDAGLGWSLANMIRNTGGIIHFIAGGQPVNLAARTKIATIAVLEISSGSTTIGFTGYIYNDSPVETAVADDSQPPQVFKYPNITLIPGTITIN